ERLELTGVRDIRDLQALSPSFSVVTNNRLSTATPAIRGIGTLGNNPAIESSVGVFIDGVYRARPGAAMGELGSFERIELLKGPQSTLFGRNTAAGAISLITKSPNLDEFEGWGEISYGNYDFYRTSGFLSGPIIQGRLGANAELVYANRDGWAENQNGQDDSQDRDRLLARVQLAGDISDKVSFRVIGDFTDYEDNCCASSLATLDGSNGALVQRW
ncbi:MAG: TonB-dependent receptor plug domain-containing protein, partial [Alphaproteobacteria bacterium]|nr:TonB-dependent receptor plug domain-containing protein [Alphaproteobacteria bacterium]